MTNDEALMTEEVQNPNDKGSQKRAADCSSQLPISDHRIAAAECSRGFQPTGPAECVPTSRQRRL